MWVGKKNHKFQKAKPYQVGTLRIVAMQKRENSPAKKMFKSSTVCTSCQEIKHKKMFFFQLTTKMEEQ